MNPDWLVSSGRSSGATPISRLISARSNHRVGQLQAEVKLHHNVTRWLCTRRIEPCRRPPLTFGVFSWLCLHFHSLLRPPTAVVGLADSASTQRRRLAIRRILSNPPAHCGARMRRDLYAWLGSENEYTYRFGIKSTRCPYACTHAYHTSPCIHWMSTSA